MIHDLLCNTISWLRIGMLPSLLGWLLLDLASRLQPIVPNVANTVILHSLNNIYAMRA